LLIGLSTILSFIVNIFLHALKTPKEGWILSFIGVIIAVLFFLVVAGMMLGLSLLLLNDPKGYDWGRKK